MCDRIITRYLPVKNTEFTESIFFNVLRNILSHWPVLLAMNIRGVNWILRPPLSSLCKNTRTSCVYIAVILTHVTDVNCLLGSAGVRDSRFFFLSFFFLPQKRRTKHFFSGIEFYYKSCTASVHGFCGPPSIISQRHFTPVPHILCLFLPSKNTVNYRDKDLQFWQQPQTTRTPRMPFSNIDHKKRVADQPNYV